MLQVKKSSVYKSPKIVMFRDVVNLIAMLKKKGKTIGMCHGGFDLLHPGHVKHFESAKKLCDVLLVSVTSNRFVSERKGGGRPIFTDKLRAYMIAHLDCVDYVVITDFKKGSEVITSIKPTYYIKGPDFIDKKTPGITAERRAIRAIGGKMQYTNDPKVSTTDIIAYIQHTKRKEMLVIADRDGTLIKNDDFFGKSKNWKKEMKINSDVVSFLSYLQTIYHTTIIVVTNQSGVARRYYTEERVRGINKTIDSFMRCHGVSIHAWEYCPYIDSKYIQKNPELKINPSYVRKKTKRKPSSSMVEDALYALGKNLSEFQTILVLGDRKEDQGLAKNLQGLFIHVKEKTYTQLMSVFSHSPLSYKSM